MKRRIWNKLLAWKVKERRKPLIISGARQVGKTWLMQEFGRKEFRNVIYLNCDDESRAKAMFEPDFDIDRILLQLQAITHTKAVAGETLIILDEIQEVPRGLASLKYFCEKAPEYHVMVAGSLLGIALHEGTSFPVGKVDMVHLYPMDFMEFLSANGFDDWAEAIKQKRWDVLDAIHDKLTECLRQYYFVGGMPEVVGEYVHNHDLEPVRYLQGVILDAYRNDVSKHAPSAHIPRINMVLRSIPSQLAKENKKFVYGTLRKGARASEFELAIQWLMDCGLVYKVSRISEVRLPLSFYEDMAAFKLFFVDCGLLGAIANTPADQMLIGNNIFKEFKGAFTEQYVMQQLVASGITDSVYYWTSGATAEVDFVVQQGNRAIPIEVKAENNVKAKSMKLLVGSTEGLRGIRFSMLPYRNQGWIENIPLYAVGV